MADFYLRGPQMSLFRRNKKNWGNNVPMRPARVLRPRNDDEIVKHISDSASRQHYVKVVGSSHSCSELVRMEGDVTLISLEDMPQEQPEIDQVAMTVRVPASMRLDHLNQFLWKNGYALENLGDIDKQTIAGAISTGTHGSGSRIGSLSSQVTHVRIITPSQGPIDCSANKNPSYLPAAQLSLGCLGVITHVTMKICTKYWLRMITKKASRGEVMAAMPDLLKNHRHVECWVWPHTCLVSLRVTDETKVQEGRGAFSRFWKHVVLENGGLWCVSAICRKWQKSCDEISMLSAALLRDDEIDKSFRVLSTPRYVKYLEMEYAIPEADAPKCLEQVMQLLDKRRFPVSFPLHYRYTAEDNIYLSPFFARAGASIDVQQFHRMDHVTFFKESENIFLSHNGRPHWGKIHSLKATDLKTMYPKWDEFQNIRQLLDPNGVFLTPSLRALLEP